MPPSRPRALDDSRSETSSTIGHIRERSMMLAATGSGVSKTKRAAPNSRNASAKPALNTSTHAAAASSDIDPNLPRTDWATISPSLLRSYRSAYRLPTQSPYTQPHAELIYNSSPTALRAPSAVLARRRLRDLKHQRRKPPANGVASASTLRTKSKQKEKEIPDADQSSTTNSDNFLKLPSPTHHTASSHSLDGTSDVSASQLPRIPTPAIPPEHIGQQTPAALATTIRKHFNAQQLSEAETVARFVYVVRQTKARDAAGAGVRVEGGDGDGMGSWMGSHGREVRRGEGGEVGFRLRFRP